MLGSTVEGSEDNGIIPRAVDHIFSFINSQHANTPVDNDFDAPPPVDTSPLGQVHYLVSLSFLEIYNEHVHDLLSFSHSKINLDVREDTSTGGFHVPNLSKHIVTDRAELIRLIQRGGEHRSVTATIMNEASSRSHSMLTLVIEKSYKRTPAQEAAAAAAAALLDDDQVVGDNTMVVQSKLNLVDR